jgi:cytochrome c oxidase cbb3-type subunit III
MKNRISRLIILAAVLTMPVWLNGQAEGAPNLNFWEKAFGSMTLLGGAIVVAAAMLAIVRLFGVIMKMEELRILKEKGVDEIVEAYRQPQTGWWSRFMKSATKTVPVEQEKDIMFDHEYDGIRELDNKLPPWWLWMFYASIAFAVVYWGIYEIGSGPSLTEEYDTEMVAAKAEVDAYVAKQSDAVNENNATELTDEAELALGSSIFVTNCFPCHGMNLEGNAIGPNLTDEYWIHGGGMQNLFKTIKYGVIEKGMQPWKDVLKAKDIQRVASYILSKQGTNPPNAKEPQGEKWTPDAASSGANTATQAGAVNENDLAPLTDPAELELGKTIFVTNCFPCHGMNLEGNAIGPNLTDEYWIHGGGINNMVNTISTGNIEKGMMPWKGVLPPEDIHRVASYILSKQGTNPPNAKEPQGEKWTGDN